MKRVLQRVISSLVAIVCCSSPLMASPIVRWKNGGTSLSVAKVKFGTHDWIFWKGYLLAKDDVDLAWLETNVNYAFFGTEAPDLGKLRLPVTFRNKVQGNYKDTRPCHCVLYSAPGEVVQSFAADRLEAEYLKAKAAIEVQNWKLAAFYVGAMAHYAGDLSQFMHLMGKDSRWLDGKGENQKIHAKYEKVLEARVKFQDRTLSIMEPFIRPKSISPNDPNEIAFGIASFTDTGGGTDLTPGEMYDRILTYNSQGKITKPDKWDQDFVDQTGRNVNHAANSIAKLLRLLMSE